MSNNEFYPINAEPIYPDLTPPPETITVSSAEDASTDKSSSVSDSSVSSENYDEIDKIIYPDMSLDIDVSSFETKKTDKIKHEGVKESSGYPINYGDPYPIDKKIVEMQSHHPVLTPGSDIDTLFVATEKRLTQLENILSTVSRMVFRLASRVHINCVYYGGQDTFQKYNCIRCLNDDLINDCQSVSLDQCLNCTRYEPIIGQIYDVISDPTQNTNIVLDNTQASYSDINKHEELSRIEKMHDESEKATKFTDIGDPPVTVKEEWPESFVMNWTETPVTSQSPKISSYQYGDGPLYDADKILETAMLNLKSQVYTENNMYTGGSMEQYLNKEYHGLLVSQDEDINTAIEKAKNIASGAQTVVNRMIQYNYYNAIKAHCMDLDPLFVLAIIGVESTGNPNDKTGSYVGLMQISSKTDNKTIEELCIPEINIEYGVKHYKEMIKYIKNADYPLYALSAYNSGNALVEAAWNKMEQNGFSGVKDIQAKWSDFGFYLRDAVKEKYPQWNALEKFTYFPKIVYMYHALKDVISALPDTETNIPIKDIFLQPAMYARETKYDGKYRFPFKEEDLSKVRFTSDFKPPHRPNHKGIDLAAPEGTVILAIGSGTVTKTRQRSQDIINKTKTDSDTRGNYIIISHEDGEKSLYYHLKDYSIFVKEGDHIEAGTPIALVGTTGQSSGFHLHLGIMSSNDEYVDPKNYYVGLTSNMASRNEKLG